MTTYLGKSCLFGVLSVCIVEVCHFVCECASFPFVFEGGMLDLIVHITVVPDHCLSFVLDLLSA